MDRLILQPGAIPLDTDGGSIQRNAMIALGYLARAAIGTGTVVDGLACSPTAPASMIVNIGQGSVISLETIDATAFGSLPVDGNPLVKVGVNAEGVTPFTLTAPTTSGQSINYLIEATFQESDGTAVVLPYYNPANPAQPFSGPANSGAAQNTVRAQKVELQLKAGAAATTGTQATPAVDSGWVGLYVITVNFGQSTVTAGSIAQYTTAPFVGGKLGNALQASSSLTDASGLLASSGWVQALLSASQRTGVVGETRNAQMNVTSAVFQATFTADEIVVGAALGGASSKIGSFNQVINLGATGAGGMDTGTPPASGYVAIYAIYNPTTGVSALLATNATSSAAPTIYGGAHMPAGYTMSALVSVWPTNGSNQFVVGLQRGRRISLANAQALITSSVFAIEALSIASIVPPNAARVGGSMSAITTAVGIAVLNIYAGSALIGVQTVVAGQAASEGIDSNYIVDLSLAQNIYCSSTNTTGTPTFQIFVSFYEF